jgi:PAB1-binding protein PBP1
MTSHHSKTSASSSASRSAGNSSSSDSQSFLRDRFLSLLLLAVGQNVTVTLADGTKLQGVFYTATPFSVPNEQHCNKFVFKQVRVLEEGTSHKFQTGSTAILDMADVVNVMIPHMRLDAPTTTDKHGAAATSNGFRTDTEISATAGAGKSQSLEAAGAAWTGDGLAAMTLSPPVSASQSGRNSRADALRGSSGGDSSSGLRGSPSAELLGDIGKWDQFQANEKLFNVKATYDENIYTTSLDKSKMGAQQIKAAEKLAKEIETQTTTNIHMAEERGFKVETDYDEEDLYSGVLKPSGKEAPAVQQSSAKSSAAPKMNYAAAAAKQTQTLPPGFNATAATADANSKPPAKPEPSKDVAKSVAADKAKAPDAKQSQGETVSEASVAKAKDETKAAEADTSAAAKPKLNPNAKSFSLSISAKPFTPVFGGDQPPPVIQQHPQQMQYAPIDPHTGLPLGMDPNAMHSHAYMQHAGPMGHPGKFI